MTIKFDAAKLYAFARHDGVQMALALTVMVGMASTGLYYEAVPGTAPDGALTTHRSAETARERDGLASPVAPTVRIVALPTSSTSPAMPQRVANVIPEAAIVPKAAPKASCNEACETRIQPRPLAVPETVARPTPRPAMAAVRQDAVQSPRIVETEAPLPPMPMPMPANVPELVRDEIPEPGEAPRRAFGIANLVAGGGRIVEGASSVGLYAVDRVGDIAEGALDLVLR